MFIAIGLAYLINHFSSPVYQISSSILVKENETQRSGGDVNNFINSNLFGNNQNFQNELWVIKSAPVIEQTIRNLDLEVSYYRKDGFQFHDAYQDVPFQVSYLPNHAQPLNVRFNISFLNNGSFQLKAASKEVSFYNFETDKIAHRKEKWAFNRIGKLGELIETPDLAFIIKADSIINSTGKEVSTYGFTFKSVASLKNSIANSMEFNVIDRAATVIEIIMRSGSLKKGINIVNELMNVYSEQNLERKNHIASITIDYIEKQLNEISDSLSQTEDNLQNFRSSNQLLNLTDQAAGITTQNINLQNQLAELVSRKRYYDYVSDYLLNNDNFSNMMLPAAIGIQDQLLNNLMSELISAQAQRSNLIENNQERNPLVQKLSIQIENAKKTISENITAVGKTTSISIDEMNKRIRKIEGEISRLPITQRQLGSIERKYRLNDAIYNYMLEKRAEAKITKASNLPDNVIIEPASMLGSSPISPNKPRNYLIAFFLGLLLPYSYILIKSVLNNKIEAQDDIKRLTDVPVLGKILHNKYKTSNVMFEFPKSNIAESFRALRTNLDFYVRGGQKKVIVVTSCIEGEGKSFVSQNLAMSYAQLGRKTILVGFDMRKPKTYFEDQEEPQEGLSSYMINKIGLEDIIRKSPQEKLDYILSGILPPNPVELIALEKTEELLTKLKNDYDIIVLDTTPLAQVTDAFLLMNHAELKIIIARYNLTLKRVFSLIMKDLELKNVGNVCVVLNDNRYYSDQYGYGYGYYGKGKIKNGKKRKLKT
jgi:capsular exopolysaccharide synthesis family protein